MNAQELASLRPREGRGSGGHRPHRAAREPRNAAPLDLPRVPVGDRAGRRILRLARRLGTNFHSTRHVRLRWLEDNFLSRTYDVTCHLGRRARGRPLFEAIPDGMPVGPVAEGKPAPNVIVDLDSAAQAAGLGEIGLGGFFLTPEYGPRQRFALILTDCVLEPDPVIEKRLCGDCGACADACPFGAIDVEKKVIAGVPGHQMEVATIDYRVCRSCPNGAMAGPGRGDRPDRGAAASARACVVRLEEAGKLANKFENRFRKRKPWALDLFWPSARTRRVTRPLVVARGRRERSRSPRSRSGRCATACQRREHPIREP